MIHKRTGVANIAPKDSSMRGKSLMRLDGIIKKNDQLSAELKHSLGELTREINRTQSVWTEYRAVYQRWMKSVPLRLSQEEDRARGGNSLDLHVLEVHLVEDNKLMKKLLDELKAVDDRAWKTANEMDRG